MKTSELKASIIPPLATFCGSPIIMADGVGDKPNGQHATYKITTPYGKGTGQPEQTIIQTETDVKLRQVNEYRTIISFTAYSMDEDESLDLAKKIYDWFAFDGYDVLDAIGVVIVEQTDITGRDAFIVENYERRNGFDVIIRIMDEKEKNVNWFDKIIGITD